jgi:ATP-dependent Zn protease
MEHYYAQTKQLIVANKDKLDKLIARLIEEKTLLGDQVQTIIRCA